VPKKMSPGRILLVDDSKTNLDVLVEILKDDYRLAVAKNGERALELAGRLAPELILLDIMMPGMDGYEVLRRLKERPETAEIPVIFISALTDAEDKAKGFSRGAVDYLIKPFDVVEVLARIKTHMELVQARRSLKKRQEILERMVRKQTNDLRATQREVVFRLGLAADIRDRETGAHLKRIRRYSLIMARAMGMNPVAAETLSLAAALHDVGMIGVPDAVLMKKGKLTPDEWSVLKDHPTLGAKILSGGRSKLARIAERIALCHHENWDGSGYPQGLAGEDIPFEARITAICDVFDALTTKRPYKSAWPPERAAAEIERLSGEAFDPNLVAVFSKVLPRFEKILARLPEEDAEDAPF
jgi:putative two-component system response regulator